MGLRLTLATTVLCQLNCNECLAKRWKDSNTGYELTIKDLNLFLDVCDKSGYKFKKVALGGAEPLLWSRLIPSLVILKSSNIGVEHITLATNGLEFKKENLKFINNVLSMIDYVRISDYGFNRENINYLYSIKPDNVKVSVLPREYFYDTTLFNSAPIESLKTMDKGIVTIKCICQGIMLVGQKVYVCSGARAMFGGRDDEPDESSCLWTKVKPNFLSKLEVGQEGNYEFCKYCINNVLLRKKLNQVRSQKQ